MTKWNTLRARFPDDEFNEIERIKVQYGLSYNEIIRSGVKFYVGLTLAKELVAGFVLTVEPGIYFIPHLIDQWKAENKYNEFINYDSLDSFVDFGGIRIEDNIVITEDGYRILGPHIPRTVEEIETIMSS